MNLLPDLIPLNEHAISNIAYFSVKKKENIELRNVRNKLHYSTNLYDLFIFKPHVGESV